MAERAQTDKAKGEEVERGHRRRLASAAPVASVGPAPGFVDQLKALQRSAGNRAVQQLVQRRLDAALQRHPEHAPEEEDIQRSVAERDAVAVQRHPEHAPEEEEIQRVAAPVQRVPIGVSRESKKALKKRMKKEYGAGKFAGNIPKAMLERLDDILKKLPRSHVAGNDSLKAITAGGGIGSASAYDYTTRQIEMKKPESWMPWWLYLLLDKGTKWQRTMMDEGAMTSFDIDASHDQELGLTGKREVMAGVSNVLAQERLVDWTVRHEMGHAVDQQIKFMPTRGRLNMFGGWNMHDTVDRRAEVAKAFLSKAGFTDSEQATKVELAATLLDKANRCLRVTEPKKLQDEVDAIAKALNISVKDATGKIKVFDESAAVAFAAPWTFADGGGARLEQDGRMYHVDHYGTWISYLAAARDDALSNYQFSSPGEWFAESYAAFYDPRKNSPARSGMPDDVRQWFTANLGPPSFSRKEGRKSSGQLTDDQDKLGTLKDLDDQVAAALNDPTKTVKVLPDDLKHLVEDS